MAYDGITMAAVHRELKLKLAGSRVDKIYQPSRYEITLHLRNKNQAALLVCSADPGLSRVHLSAVKQENPAAAPAFCMLLRKHLTGTRLTAVEQEGLERVLTFTFSSFGEIGFDTKKHLICEITGKHANLVLAVPRDDGELHILGSIRTVTESMSRHRLVMPGETYIPPPPQEKLLLSQISEEELACALAGEDGNRPELLLVSAVNGLGPETARELIFRAAGGEKLHPLEMVRSLTIQLRYLADIVREGYFEPCIARSPDGKVHTFAPLRLTRFPAEWLSLYPSVNEALDAYYTRVHIQQREKHLKQRLFQLTAGAYTRTDRKKKLQEEELREMQGAERFRLYGEMLVANLHQATGGNKEVEVINYYSPGQDTMLIPLNPARSLQENAQLYFKKYRKLKVGEGIMQGRILNTCQELDYLASLQSAIQHADLESLLEIEEEMEQSGLIRSKKEKKQRPGNLSSPLHFISADGIDIFVGRNNRQNDRLTLKLAADNDTWLHTKGIPGAHVIIKSPSPPPDTLHEAALFAARYSRAAASSNVPVDYTLVKYVHKPKGAKPGMVIYDHQRTLFVTVNENEKL